MHLGPGRYQHGQISCHSLLIQYVVLPPHGPHCPDGSVGRSSVSRDCNVHVCQAAGTGAPLAPQDVSEAAGNIFRGSPTVHAWKVLQHRDPGWAYGSDRLTFLWFY